MKVKGSGQPETAVIDVKQFVDERRISRYQIAIIAFCYLFMSVETYDMFCVGYVAPYLQRQWGVASENLGTLITASLFGMAIGALISGWAVAKTSPKWVLVSSCLLIGVASLACAAAPSPLAFALARGAAGIGIGACLPIPYVIVFEYAPSRRSSFLVNLMTLGGSIGGVSCGVATAILVPRFGWPSVFVVGGALPLVFAVLAYLLMPQPLRYLVSKKKTAAVRLALSRIDPSRDFKDASFVVFDDVKTERQEGLRLLLSRRYRRGLMMWISYFASLTVYYFLSGWLPTLIASVGGSLRQTALMPTLLTIGGLFGAIGLGLLMDRFNKRYVVTASFLFSGVAIIAMAAMTGNFLWFAICLFICGSGLQGALASMPGLAVSYYPTTGRAMGLALMTASGRLGGIVGSMSGGFLIQAHVAPNMIYFLLAIPIFVATILLLATGPAPNEIE